MSAPRILLAVALLAAASAARADWDLRARITCPGASVPDLTERVTLPAVRVARNITGVLNVDSVARPEVLTMTLRIAGDGSDRRLVRLDAQSQLEANLKHMSVDISKIEVEDVYEHVFPRIVAVSGKGTSMRTLKRRAKWLRDELQCCPNVQNVKMMGEEQYVVAMLIPKGHFAISCSVASLSKMLAGYLTLEPAGSLNVGGRRLRIAADNVIQSSEDVMDLPFTIDPSKDGKGETVMLRDQLKIDVQRSTTPPISMTGVDGERCVLLAVSFHRGMTDSELDKVIANAQAEAPLGIEIDTVYDATRCDRDRTLIFDLTMAEGVRIVATDERLRDLAREIRKLPGVERVISAAGAFDIAMSEGQSIGVPAPNKGTLIVELAKRTSPADICRSVKDISEVTTPAAIVLPRERYRNDGYGVWHSQEIVSRYDGCDIQHRAERMVAAARATPGVHLSYCDWGDPVEYLRYDLYESHVRQLCLSRSDISLSCRSLLEGYPVTDFWYMGERLPVVLRMGTDDGEMDVQKLATSWTYSSALDRFIPFGQVVRNFDSCSEVGCVLRRNGEFVAKIFVWADNDDAIDAVKAKWAELEKK